MLRGNYGVVLPREPVAQELFVCLDYSLFPKGRHVAEHLHVSYADRSRWSKTSLMAHWVIWWLMGVQGDISRLKKRLISWSDFWTTHMTPAGFWWILGMFILENVKRILTNDKGRTWKVVWNTLTDEVWSGCSRPPSMSGPCHSSGFAWHSQGWTCLKFTKIHCVVHLIFRIEPVQSQIANVWILDAVCSSYRMSPSSNSVAKAAIVVDIVKLQGPCYKGVHPPESYGDLTLNSFAASSMRLLLIKIGFDWIWNCKIGRCVKKFEGRTSASACMIELFGPMWLQLIRDLSVLVATPCLSWHEQIMMGFQAPKPDELYWMFKLTVHQLKSWYLVQGCIIMTSTFFWWTYPLFQDFFCSTFAHSLVILPQRFWSSWSIDSGSDIRGRFWGFPETSFRISLPKKDPKGPKDFFLKL